MISNRTDEPDNLGYIGPVLSFQPRLELPRIGCQLEQRSLQLRERDSSRMNVRYCIHQIVCLIDYDNMVFDGKAKGFSG